MNGVTQPAAGTGSAAVSGGGSTVTYTPPGNFSGPASFTYTIGDGNGGSATATVTVTVSAQANRNPVATNDAATTNEDVAKVVSVLGNDSDPDGDPLTVTGVTQPAHGVVSITGGGATTTYTPAANYNGGDSYTYTIGDGRGGSATATVTMTVSPVNDNPVAVNDQGSTTSPNAVVLSVRSNDSDIDGNVLTVTAVTQPANGTAAISGGGTTVTYTPPANYSGPASFSYTVSDGQGGSASANVLVTVTAGGSNPGNRADLVVTLLKAPAMVQTGATFSMTFDVLNRGPSTATGNMLQVGGAKIYVTLLSSSVPCPPPGIEAKQCTLPDLPSGQRATVVLQYRYDGPGAGVPKPATIKITGLVSSAVTDPVTSNNSATATIKVQ